MKRKKYIIIGLVVVIIVILIIALVVSFSRRNTKDINDMEEENIVNENAESNTSVADESIENQNPEEIESMKNEINATGNTNIYYVDEEYDGRKILQIKPDAQFEVDIAGIMKNSMPEENEISELIAKAPTNNGVWISEQSRESFSNLLKNNNITDFNISDEGYLQINNSTNDMANKLVNMINSDKLYIINMTGIAYQRDYISGEITEYPFEDMDPYQAIEPYQKDNKIILEITTNKMQKLTENEILDAITSY